MIKRQHYLLIDFENVQPETLAALSPENVHVLVFVGASQTKVPLEIAASLQALGSRAEYVRIAGNGRNALDFHIAYYVGKLAATAPAACFHIVSRDTGFDPLIAHLRSSRISADRIEKIGDLPSGATSTSKARADRVELALRRLHQQKLAKPRTVKTLESAVFSFFQKQLSAEEVTAVIDGMVEVGAISLAGTKVSYISSADGPATAANARDGGST